MSEVGLSVVSEEVAKKLRSLRIRRFIAHAPFGFVFFAGLLVVGVGQYSTKYVDWLFQSSTVNIIYVVISVLAVVTVIFPFGITTYRCPRCSECFHVKGSFCNVFARKCMHCGLKLNAKAGGNES
jgi:hypothetical protein